MSTTLTWQGKQKPETYPAISLCLREIFAPGEERVDQQISQSPNPQSPISNLLFYADNLPTLAHLAENGFRGKIKLIYLDPPYQTGVAWRRRVRLRGTKAITMQTSADHVIGTQTQYYDRWSEEDYLQFIYDRLHLLRELLAEDGSLWLHCDLRQAHHLRCLLEEVFGTEHFLNTITWRSQTARGAKVNAFYFPSSSHSIHIFAKNRLAPTVWNQPKRRIVLSEAEAEKQFLRDDGGFFRTSDPGSYSFASLKLLHSEGRLYAPYGGEIVFDEARQRVYGSKGGNLGVKYYLQKVGRKKWQMERAVDNLWDDVPGLGTNPTEDLGYPTQKTEALLQRIIETASNPGDFVLDAFMGSGTTLAVAAQLGRKTIGIDQNRGALLTTRQRLLSHGNPFALFETEREKAKGQPEKLGRRNERARSLLRTPNSTLLAPSVSLSITRNLLDPATIELSIDDYAAPTLAAQLSSGRHSGDTIAWKSLVDSVEIDPDYNGLCFRWRVVDAPLKKTMQVAGCYRFHLPPTSCQLAVRITNVLGEETLILKETREIA